MIDNQIVAVCTAFGGLAADFLYFRGRRISTFECDWTLCKWIVIGISTAIIGRYLSLNWLILYLTILTAINSFLTNVALPAVNARRVRAVIARMQAAQPDASANGEDDAN